MIKKSPFALTRQDPATMSLSELSMKSTLDTGKEIRDEILGFFKKRPEDMLILDFCKKTRLDLSVAQEIFQKLKADASFSWEQRSKQILFKNIHFLDRLIIEAAINEKITVVV